MVFSVISIELSSVKYWHGFGSVATNRHLMTSFVWMQSIYIVKQRDEPNPFLLSNFSWTFQQFNFGSLFFRSVFGAAHFQFISLILHSASVQETTKKIELFIRFSLLLFHFFECSGGNVKSVCVCVCISETAIVQMWSRMGSSFNYSMCLYTIALNWIPVI